MITQFVKKISYPFAAFSRGSYAAFVNSLLPLYLSGFTTNTALIGFLVSISGLEGAISPAIVGPLSDRVHSKLGRRKIFILVGSIFTSGFLLVFPFVTSFPLLVTLIITTGLFASVPTAAHLAMITKNSKESERSKITALMGIFYLVGQVLLTLLALFFWKEKITFGAFAMLAVLFLTPSVPLLIFSKDDIDPDHHAENAKASSLPEFFMNIERNVYMLSQFLLWFGMNSVLPFFTLFIREYLHFSQEKAILFYLIIVLASGIFAYPFALLGKKIGDKKMFQIGLLFLLLAGVLGIFAKQIPENLLYAIAFCAGIGNASTAVFSFSIFSKLVPEKSIGLASGIHAFLISGLAPVAAFISGLLIGIFDYPVMFLILILTTSTSILLMFKKNHAN